MAKGYEAGIYRGDPPYRNRWAVCGPSGEWYFPSQYGKQAARRLAEKLNRVVL